MRWIPTPIPSSEKRASKNYANEKGALDHEQVQNAVERIFQKEYRIERLTPEAEAGRLAGSRLLVGSSLIVGGKARTGETSGARERKVATEIEMPHPIRLKNDSTISLTPLGSSPNNSDEVLNDLEGVLKRVRPRDVKNLTAAVNRVLKRRKAKS